jgi:hypothetical protein
LQSCLRKNEPSKFSEEKSGESEDRWVLQGARKIQCKGTKGLKLRRAGALIGSTRGVVPTRGLTYWEFVRRKRKIWPRESREGEKRSLDDHVDSMDHSGVTWQVMRDIDVSAPRTSKVEGGVVWLRE